MSALKFPCLVLDHDDTVVDSTARVHYPCFVEYLARFVPDYHCTLEEYFLKNFDPGVVAFFRDEVGLGPEQMRHEQAYWYEYVQHHIPLAYPGVRDILLEQKRRGGRVCVVSHSYRDNILRDYRSNNLPEPDLVFGWECPPEERKPSPHALHQIMARFSLSPRELLVVDDLKPGYDMARAAGVAFGAAGWANDIVQIERFMRAVCDVYLKTTEDLFRFLFDED